MSGRRDGSFVRSERLMMISRAIVKDVNLSTAKSCNYEDLVIWIQFHMGLTDKTAREYVAVVVAAKGWQLNDGVIVLGEK